MEWIIKIEEKPNQRIHVWFNPVNESLTFCGEYKLRNKDWTVFSEISRPLWIAYPDIVPGTTSNLALISLEIIQDTLFDVYKLMKKRIEAYAEIDEGFAHIKMIEIAEE